MKEITLKQICWRLNVTAPWVGKVITKLNLHKVGRGKRRIFSKDEYVRIRNIKIMRECGISWAIIERLRKKEDLAKSRIEKSYPLGKYKPGEKIYQMNFMLVESLKTDREPTSLVREHELSGGLKEIIHKAKENKKVLEDFLNTSYYTFQ